MCTAARRADLHARQTRQLPHEDPRAEVGEEVRVNLSLSKHGSGHSGVNISVGLCSYVDRV